MDEADVFFSSNVSVPSYCEIQMQPAEKHSSVEGVLKAFEGNPSVRELLFFVTV